MSITKYKVDKKFVRSDLFHLKLEAMFNINLLPIANPIQSATSAMAYTLPYTEACLISTRYPIIAIMDESTIPTNTKCEFQRLVEM